MTHVAVLFTFCPPCPPERTKLSSMSVAQIPSAAIRRAKPSSFSGMLEKVPMAQNYQLEVHLPLSDPKQDRAFSGETAKLNQIFRTPIGQDRPSPGRACDVLCRKAQET